MNHLSVDHETRWFTPEKKLDIAYQLAGTELNISGLKKYHSKRLKEIKHLRPIEIADHIIKERLNRIVRKELYL